MKNLNQLEKSVRKTLAKTKNAKAFSFEQIANEVAEKFENKTYNFEQNIFFKKIVSMGKRRMVANLKAGSTEFFLANHINELTKQNTNYKLVNHHLFVEQLIHSLQKIENTQNFTLVEFDFVNFYNSVSAQYVFEKYLKYYNYSENDFALFQNYVNTLPYCFAGVCTSNTFAEIILNDFKTSLENSFENKQLVSCIRYGDDFILIFNEGISETEIQNTIQNTINQVFYNSEINVKHQNKVRAHLSGKKIFVYK